MHIVRDHISRSLESGMATLKGGPSLYGEPPAIVDLRARIYQRLLDAQRGIKKDPLQEVYGKVFDYFVKAYRRSIGDLGPAIPVSDGELDSVLEDLKKISALFNALGVRVDAELLKKALVYKSLEYWEHFVESEEVALFHEIRPDLIYRAVTVRPSDPLSYLKELLEKVGLLNENPEFASFHDKLHILLEVVQRNFREPEVFLRRKIEEARRICADPKFAIFSQAPELVEYVVATNKNPHRYFRDLMKKGDEILQEEEFAPLRDHRLVFYCELAKLNKSRKDPRGALRMLLTRIENAQYADTVPVVSANELPPDPRAERNQPPPDAYSEAPAETYPN